MSRPAMEVADILHVQGNRLRAPVLEGLVLSPPLSSIVPHAEER